MREVVWFFGTGLTRAHLVVGKTVNPNPGFKLATNQSFVVFTKFTFKDGFLNFKVRYRSKWWEATLDESTGDLCLMRGEAIAKAADPFSYAADENYLWGV